MDLSLLATWAREHGSAFDRVQAQAAGFGRRWIDAAVPGVLRSFGRGVFVSQEVWADADKEGRHVIEAAARMLQLGGGWHADRRTAAILHGLPLLGDPPARPQLVRESGTTKGSNGYERIAALPDEDRAVVAGHPSVAMARSVVDLARDEPLRNALVAADGALRRGLDKETLTRVASRCADWPGGFRAVHVARLSNGLHETPLESMSWGNCADLRLPMPEPQVRIFLGEQQIARVDGLWRRYNTIGQADGLYKIKSWDDVIRDKHQDELLESLGFEVARWGWDEAFHRPRAQVARIRRGFDRGKRQLVDPRVRFVPTTLEQSLRWTGLLAS